MPRQQVAAAAVAVMIEADLGPSDPASGSEAGGGGILDRSVRAIDEPVEVSAAPAELDSHRCIERHRQPDERPEGEPVQGTAFRTRDRIARKARPPPEVRLAPFTLAPQDSERNRHVGAHDGIVGAADDAPLTGRLPRHFG